MNTDFILQTTKTIEERVNYHNDLIQKKTIYDIKKNYIKSYLLNRKIKESRIKINFLLLHLQKLIQEQLENE